MEPYLELLPPHRREKCQLKWQHEIPNESVLLADEKSFERLLFIAMDSLLTASDTV